MHSVWPDFFQKKFFFGIFLTTILKINPKINPNINPFFLIIIIIIIIIIILYRLESPSPGSEPSSLSVPAGPGLARRGFVLLNQGRERGLSSCATRSLFGKFDIHSVNINMNDTDKTNDDIIVSSLHQY